ncbi:MAG: cation-efflux pump [Actinobacteria bacterium]|nr:cation-efflux pump [Actinomycetota bacterium]
MRSVRQAKPSDRRHVERVALVSLGAAGFLIASKLAAGLASGSLALLSEAAHSGLDAGATLLTFFAVRIASRPPDTEHPYGHGKAENISALIETMALFGLSVWIAKEAIERLTGDPAHVEATWYAFAVMGISIVVDFSRARVLREAGRKYRSPALEADALHFTADLLTSAIVLVGLVFVRFGLPEADAMGGLAIAGYVGFQSIRLGRKSIDVLMDRAPIEALEEMEAAAAAVPGVEEVRRARVRYAGGQPHADIVVGISRTVPLETAHQVTEEVERVIAEVAPGADVVVHVEPLADESVLAQRVVSIAAREPRVRQVHNVLASFHSEGIHISLHAKFPGDMSLSEAHDIAEALEAEIASDIPEVVRVDTHLEPLESQSDTREDVTSDHSRLVREMKVVAESQPEVRNCHEVLVSRAAGGQLAIVMHCEAEAGISVSETHDASTRIENQVHHGWPQVERVTVHFEPVGTP